jgi:bifunctional DNA-binding transcriptional regulator/antitoxin component of YhaV-PrlF toxin-antitoxin module
MKKTQIKLEYDEYADWYYIALPEEIMKELNLQEGDDMLWTDNEDGTFTLKKKEKINE